MDDLSPKTRALLDAARSFDDPTDEDRDRVRNAVFLRVGSLAAAGTVAITAAKTSSAAASAAPLIANTLTSTTTIFGGLAAKVGVAVVVAGAMASGAYVAFRPSHPAPAPVAVVAANAPAPQAPPPAAPVAAPAATTEEPAAVDANDLPVDDAKPAAPHASHAHVASLEGEMKLLRTADAALRRGDSAAALSALNQEAAQYPHGALSQEREGMRVIALCSGGNVSQGQSAAQRFLSHAAKSPLASRIRSACSLGN